MKRIALIVLGSCVLFPTFAKGQDRLRDDEMWALWNSGTTKLWGANIFQGVVETTKVKPRHWSPLLRPHDFEDLYRAGANHVNLSVPGPFEPDSGKCNAIDWQLLKDRIEWAKKAKLKVVISFRTGPGRNEADITKPFTSEVWRDLLDKPNSPYADKFCEMWTMVANEYKNDPDVVGFDLLVEPHAKDPWKDEAPSPEFKFRKEKAWYNVAQKAIKAIRTKNTITPILIEPDAWAAAVYLNKVDGEQLSWRMPEGERLVCAAHQYAPDGYTRLQENFDVEFVDLKKAFAEIRAWRKDPDNKNAPVCVNEFGLVQRRSNGEFFLKKELRLLKADGLNHAVWLWEVTDPKQDYRDWDVRSNPRLVRELMANWQENSDNQDNRRTNQRVRESFP